MADSKGNASGSSTQLHDVPLREVAGRDTMARYQVQYRAAALECLKILDRSVSRVYCDVHDDYVSETDAGGVHAYRFYQVKTKAKRNHRWSGAELVSIQKAPKPKKVRKPKKGTAAEVPAVEFEVPSVPEAPRIIDAAHLASVGTSYLGNLLVHTVNFGDSCDCVVFQTNVGLDDDVEALIADIESGTLEHPTAVLLVNSLADIFKRSPPLTNDDAKRHLQKLRIEPGLAYLAIEDMEFEARAITAIWKYSEIPLTVPECSEIAKNVRELVQKKSLASLPATLTADSFSQVSSVDIDDLLEILSISKDAYRELCDHGDPSALRSVSIIQRTLRQSNLSEAMVDHASRWKVEWDDWYRTHARNDLHLALLVEKLQIIYDRWARQEIRFEEIKDLLTKLLKELSTSPIGATLTETLLLGGIFSIVVKGVSR